MSLAPHPNRLSPRLFTRPLQLTSQTWRNSHWHNPPVSLHVMALHQPSACPVSTILCVSWPLCQSFCFSICATRSLSRTSGSPRSCLYFLGSLCFPLLSFSLVFSCGSFSLSLLNSVYRAISPSRWLSPPVLLLSSLHSSLSPSLYSLVSLSLPLSVSLSDQEGDR